MSELEVKRTPELIGAEIRMYVDAGRRMTLLCGIEIGRRLTEAKEMLEHGAWLPWLEKETDFSERSAQNYMRVFREYGAAQQSLFGTEANTQALADLPITKALSLLAVPEEERESFAAEVHAEKISTRELEEAIRERDEAKKEAETLANQVEDMAAGNRTLLKEKQTLEEKAKKAEVDLQKKENELKAAQVEIRDLQNRPVEVAVQKDEEAEKRAEALQKEVEDLKKQLRTSDRILSAFQVYFNDCQQNLNEMKRLVQEKQETDPDGAAKLKKAVQAVLDKYKTEFGG